MIKMETELSRIAKALERLAAALEKERHDHVPFETVIPTLYSKESILKYASEDELFALFHTFKEYYNKVTLDSEAFSPLDSEIGEVIRQLKQNYK